MTEDITSFQGEHRWLSNFSPAACFFGGLWFPTTENAYQAGKSLDKSAYGQFCFVSPGKAKRLGKSNPIRPDWLEQRLPIMENLLRQKFQNPFYKQKLIETGCARIVEGNTWGDTFWGVCNEKGENNLGKLLMKIRKELQ